MRGTAPLRPYPFARLRALVADLEPPAGGEALPLTVGEPALSAPEEWFTELFDPEGFRRYPPITGTSELRTACAEWLTRRYGLPPALVDPERRILAVGGTREALFAVAQWWIDPTENSVVLLPTPSYQIYEGAARLAGAEPYPVPADAGSSWLPAWERVPEAIWRRAVLLYVNSPYNPTGAALDLAGWCRLLELARRHRVLVVADECYADLYYETPPAGVLEAAVALGDERLTGLLAFHSLSKRSGLAGLRSGFVVGDPELIADLARYRSYHGVGFGRPLQRLSARAWRDEELPARQRALHRDNLALAWPVLERCLEPVRPAGTFFVWARVPGGDDERFVRDLYAASGLLLLPGSYLSVPVDGHDPGRGWVRISLAVPTTRLREALARLERFCRG